MLEIQTYYNEYIQFTGKIERGNYVRNLAEDLSIDKSTIHRWFRNLEKGKISHRRCDKGKPRKAGITDEIKSDITKKVAALKIESATKTGKVRVFHGNKFKNTERLQTTDLLQNTQTSVGSLIRPFPSFTTLGKKSG